MPLQRAAPGEVTRSRFCSREIPRRRPCRSHDPVVWVSMARLAGARPGPHGRAICQHQDAWQTPDAYREQSQHSLTMLGPYLHRTRAPDGSQRQRCNSHRGPIVVCMSQSPAGADGLAEVQRRLVDSVTHGIEFERDVPTGAPRTQLHSRFEDPPPNPGRFNFTSPTRRRHDGILDRLTGCSADLVHVGAVRLVPAGVRCSRPAIWQRQSLRPVPWRRCRPSGWMRW